MMMSEKEQVSPRYSQLTGLPVSGFESVGDGKAGLAEPPGILLTGQPGFDHSWSDEKTGSNCPVKNGL